MITITGIGDHDRPEWLIRINGIRSRRQRWPNTLRHGMEYSDPGASHYEERYRRRVLANLERRAKSLGYVLQAAPGPA